MAGAAVAGMGDLVVRYYTTDNPSEVALLRDVMKRGIEFDGEVREDLAERIIGALGRALDKGKRKAHKHG